MHAHDDTIQETSKVKANSSIRFVARFSYYTPTMTALLVILIKMLVLVLLLRVMGTQEPFIVAVCFLLASNLFVRVLLEATFGNCSSSIVPASKFRR